MLKKHSLMLDPNLCITCFWYHDRVIRDYELEEVLLLSR